MKQASLDIIDAFKIKVEYGNGTYEIEKKSDA